MNNEKLKECIQKEIDLGPSNTNHAIMIKMLKDSLKRGNYDNSLPFPLENLNY